MRALHTAAGGAVAACVTRQDRFSCAAVLRSRKGRWGGGKKQRVRTAGDQIRLLTDQSVRSGRRGKPEGSFAKVFSDRRAWSVLSTRCLFESCAENVHHKLQPSRKNKTYTKAREVPVFEFRPSRKLRLWQVQYLNRLQIHTRTLLAGKKKILFFLCLFFSSQPA